MSVAEKYNPDAPKFSMKDNRVEALCTSVYDGDTIRAVFPIPGVGGKEFEWSLRIVGIDTPELRRSGEKEKAWAILARDRVRELILGKAVTLELGGFDKYGRVLTTVYWSGENGIKHNLTDTLQNENLGRPYEGYGTKTDWENEEAPF